MNNNIHGVSSDFHAHVCSL